MTYREFVRRVQDKSLPRSPAYIFQGDQEYLRRNGLELLKKFYSDLTNQIIYFDQDNFSPQDFFSEVSSVPFLQKNKLVVLKISSGISQEMIETLHTYLKNSSPYTVLVISTPERIDLRVGSLVVYIECTPIPDYELPQWVISQVHALGKTISREVALNLIEKTGPELNLIDQAIQKLGLFIGTRASIESDDINQLVEDQTKCDLRDFAQAILKHNKHRALSALEKLLSGDETPEKIIGYLCWYFWIKYPDHNRLSQLLDTDLSIKQGRLRPDLALKLLVLKL